MNQIVFSENRYNHFHYIHYSTLIIITLICNMFFIWAVCLLFWIFQQFQADTDGI